MNKLKWIVPIILIFLVASSYLVYEQWRDAKIKKWERKSERKIEAKNKRLGLPPYKKQITTELGRFKNKLLSENPPEIRAVKEWGSNKFYQSGIRGSEQKLIDFFRILVKFSKRKKNYSRREICTFYQEIAHYMNETKLSLKRSEFKEILTQFDNLVVKDCLEQSNFSKNFDRLIEVNLRYKTIDKMPVEYFVRLAKDIEKFKYKSSKKKELVIRQHLPRNYEPYEPRTYSETEAKRMTQKETFERVNQILKKLIQKERQKNNPNEEKIKQWKRKLKERGGSL